MDLSFVLNFRFCSLKRMNDLYTRNCLTLLQNSRFSCSTVTNATFKTFQTLVKNHRRVTEMHYQQHEMSQCTFFLTNRFISNQLSVGRLNHFQLAVIKNSKYSKSVNPIKCLNIYVDSKATNFAKTALIFDLWSNY